MATAPERIGRYRVREIIGSGGFATVYRATDERLRSDVAVKVLADNHSIDAEVRTRFIEEGRRLRKVAHPSVVTVHELGETDRAQPFLVLEWADRGDLATRVEEAHRRGRPTTRDDVLAVAQPVASALAALHARGLVHRDLAPRNLLLRSRTVTAGPPATSVPPAGLLIAPDEQLMLADLGLSKDLEAASGYTVAAGTSGFAPPEQLRKASTVDARADIWAASALVVWLICGHPPDDDGGWARELRQAGWPQGLVQVLRRGLAEDPADRHPDVGRWMDALAQALTPPAATGRSPLPAGAARRRARRGRGTQAALALVVLLAGVTAGAVVARATADASSGPRPHTERLPGGDLRTVLEDEGIRIELRGPTEIEIGAREQVTARVEGATTWLWVAPGGTVHPDIRSLEIRPESAGRATVRFLAVGDGGEVVEAGHTVVVPGRSGSSGS